MLYQTPLHIQLETRPSNHKLSSKRVSVYFCGYSEGSTYNGLDTKYKKCASTEQIYLKIDTLILKCTFDFFNDIVKYNRTSSYFVALATPSLMLKYTLCTNNL